MKKTISSFEHLFVYKHVSMTTTGKPCVALTVK